MKKNVFDFTDENSYKSQSYGILKKNKTNGGLFQINAMNVRNRQFVEDIVANTRGRSMCREDNDPPKESEFVLKRFHLASGYRVEDWRNHLGSGCGK